MFRNPSYPYVVVNDLPKVRNLERLFSVAFRAEPVLVNRPVSRNR
jgi:peptide-methionine (S)-S-oxide reductase